MPRKKKKYDIKAEDIIRQNREREERERKQQEEQEKYRREHEAEIKAQEKAKKEEEQKAVSREEDEFRKNRTSNQAKFKSEFKMSQESFMEKARENGWVFEESLRSKNSINDNTVIENIYKAAKDTADPRLIKICQDIISTPVDTNEKRGDFVANVRDQVDQVLETNHALGILKRGDLNRISAGLRGFFSEAEFSVITEKMEADRKAREEAKAKAEAERKAKLAYKAEKKAFVEQLEKNGWGDSSREIGEYIFDDYKEMSKYKLSPELKETLDTQFKKFKETKIDKNMPDTHKARMLKEFGNEYKANASVWAIEKRADKIADYFNSYTKLHFAEGIRDEKAAADKKIFDNAKVSIDKKPQAGKLSNDDRETGKDIVSRMMQKKEDANDLAAVKSAPEVRELKLHSFYSYKQKDFEQLNPEQRAEKLKEYFKVKMSDRVGASKMDKALNGAKANELFLVTVNKLKRWDSCMGVIDNPDFEFAALGSALEKMSAAKRGEHIKDYYEYHLKDAVTSERTKIRREAKAKAVGLDKEFVTVTEERSQKLNSMIETIDFNLLGQGSDQFTEMKNAIKDLTRYSNEFIKASDKDGLGIDREALLLEKQYEASKAVKAYLEHKQKDFDDDPERRNSKGRQKREQKRIYGAIEILDELEHAMKQSSKRLYDKERELRSNLMERLKNEQKILEDPNISDKEYLESLAKTVDMVKNLDGSKWLNRNPENRSLYSELHNHNVNLIYSDELVKSILDAKSSPANKALQEGYRKIHGDADNPGYKPDGKRLTLEDVWKIQGAQKEIEPFVVRKSDQIKEEMDEYRKNLLSLQVKQKLGFTKYNAQDTEIIERQRELEQQKREREIENQNKENNKRTLTLKK